MTSPNEAGSTVQLPPGRGYWLVSALVMALVCGGLCGLYRIRTYDTMFHLAAGRLIVESGAVPQTDSFSFSLRGADWLNHSWGFQVLLHGLHQLGGFALLSVYQAVVAALLVLLGLLAVRRCGGDLALAAPLALAPLLAFREVLEARPHALGFACLAATLLIVLWQLRGAGSVRGLWGLLPVYGGWATAHGSHLLALGVVALALPVAYRQQRARFVAWLACYGGLLMLALWLAPEALLQGGQHVSSGFLQGSVAEWYPVLPGDLVRFWAGRTFAALVLLTLAGATLAFRERHRASTAWSGGYPLLLLLGFVPLSFSSRRMIPLLLMGALPLWLPFATLCAQRALSRAHDAVRSAGLVAAWVVVLVLLLRFAEPFEPGIGLEGERFPRAAVDAMQAAGIRRVYNHYNFGGYLMFRGVPKDGVLVDGRAITLYPSEFLDTLTRAYDNPPLFEGVVAHFEIDGVLLPISSRRAAPLRAYLAAAPGWRLRFADDLAEFYSR